MNTNLILSAAAVLALCPLLHAQTAPALPAPPTSPAAATPAAAAPAASLVTLRYKFAVGQVRRYEYDMGMNMMMQTGQTGGGIPMDMEMHMITRQTVKSIRPTDGAATLSTQVESMHMLRGGQEIPMPEAQQTQMKQSFTLVMLPTGKVLSMTSPALSVMNAPGMDFSKNMFSGTALLPDAAVKVGDTWNGIADAAAAGIQTTFTATLMGIDQKNGATLATIQQKQSGNIDKTMTQGMPSAMSMHGQITGTANQVFDTTAGAIQSATGTAGTDMTMTFAKAADGTAPVGMPSAMKMNMQMKYTMTRLGDTSPNTLFTAPVQ